MEDKKVKLCKCGCGEAVTKPTNDYIRFHYRHPVGKDHPRRGMKHTEESKRKIAKGHSGIKLSEEHKRKISEANKGRIVTEEMRKKMSERQMGEKNHNYGKIMSEEQKEKISKGGRGLKRTEETCRRISEARRGITFSEEHKKNISESKKGSPGLKGEKNPMYGQTGDKNPFFGKKHTDETKERLSKKAKEYFQNNDPPMLGRNHSFEVRMKSSQTKKKKNGMSENDECWSTFLTPIYYLIRTSTLSKKWRSEVFKRDNYTCQHCGDSKGGNLNAHHKNKSFSDIINDNNITCLEQAMECEEFWDIDNGITLCKPCHIKEHKKAELK